jgi:hypothetical protein
VSKENINEIKIYDAMGKEVYMKTNPTNKLNEIIDFSGFVPGIYSIFVNGNYSLHCVKAGK